MVTTMRCSVISLTVLVLGTATSMPDCRTGAVSMNMTSSTSTTSTSGVILISARAVCVWPLLLVKATRGLPFKGVLIRHQRDLLHTVKQFTRKIIHARGEIAQAASELVVGDDCRNGDNQPRGGCDQCLGHARGNGAKRCRSSGAKSMKGVDNAHDGSKKAEER